jgi:hypothetical protein
MVGVETGRRVNTISREDLRRLLSDVEKQGARRVLSHGDYRDPLVQRARDLGITHAYAFEATGPRRGIVKPTADFYFGWGWDGTASGAWLADFLAAPLGVAKLEKLRRAAHAAERHLVVVLHPESQPGLCIPSGLTDLDDPATGGALYPLFTPPSPLTGLWLVPLVPSWRGLRWARDGGWTLVKPPG